jgi:hypothetical protein
MRIGLMVLVFDERTGEGAAVFWKEKIGYRR